MAEPINSTISPWMPEQDRIRLAVLGKLIEECNELAARSARCIIHGLDETDPATGRLNREELAREMADVEACLDIVDSVLSVEAPTQRRADKRAGFRRWHLMIDELAAAREAGKREGMEEAAQIAERVASFSDNLQKSAGCLTTGQAIAAAIRAKLEGV